jgi:hypothetical protein
VLPLPDAGKPVIQVLSASLAQTPVPKSGDTSFRATETVTIADDGSAVGDSKIEATGSAAIETRALVGALPPNSDADYLRAILGPGVDGTLDRGDPSKLSPEYSFSAHYRMANFTNFPGPGALPAGMAYKPFTFTALLAGAFPPSRTRSYSCVSLTAEENTTIQLPPSVAILSMPKSGVYKAAEMTLTMDYQSLGHGTIHEHTKIVIDHPQAVCSADYYNRSRADLTKMVSALRAQILYK